MHGIAEMYFVHSPLSVLLDAWTPVPKRERTLLRAEFDPSDPSWHEFLFADYPELLDEDGWTTLKEPASLDILVARTPDTCLVALWRICSHGACPLSWYPKQEHARCGCHGSRFDTEGRVLNGPATAPIRTFPTAQTETSFWIYRPL